MPLVTEKISPIHEMIDQTYIDLDKLIQVSEIDSSYSGRHSGNWGSIYLYLTFQLKTEPIRITLYSSSLSAPNS